MSNALDILCHTPVSLALLEADERSFLSELSAHLAMHKIMQPFDGRQAIWKSLNNHGIRVPAGLFENIGPHDSLEMWSRDWKFLFAMGEIVRKSSYPIEVLSQRPWAQLFSRDEESTRLILEAQARALSTNESQFNVGDWHYVQEIESPRLLRFKVKVKQITPFVRNKGIGGIIALVNCDVGETASA